VVPELRVAGATTRTTVPGINLELHPTRAGRARRKRDAYERRPTPTRETVEVSNECLPKVGCRGEPHPEQLPLAVDVMVPQFQKGPVDVSFRQKFRGATGGDGGSRR